MLRCIESCGLRMLQTDGQTDDTVYISKIAIVECRGVADEPSSQPADMYNAGRRSSERLFSECSALAHTAAY